MKCYSGRILFVDLKLGNIVCKELDEECIRKYIGQRGLAASLYIDITTSTEPVDETAIIMMTGPLTGLFGPASGRFQIVSVSALSNKFATLNCGGHFGPMMKMAGYDGLIITGESPNPVYLYISDTRSELVSATDLTGYQAGHTSDKLRGIYGQTSRVISTSGAGELGSPFAALYGDDFPLSGSAGMGAAFGSKNLKAIVCNGGLSISAANSEEYFQLAASCRKTVMEHPTAIALSGGGIEAFHQLREAIGSRRLRAFQEGIDRQSSKQLCLHTSKEEYLHKRIACYSCPIGCLRISAINNGVYQGQGPGSEREALAAFGDCVDNDISSALYCYWFCHQNGLDPAALSRAALATGINTVESLCRFIEACAADPLYVEARSEYSASSFLSYAAQAGEELPQDQDALLAFLESSGICPNCCEALSPENISELIASATGWDFTVEEGLAVGGRILAVETRLLQSSDRTKTIV